MTAVGNNRIRQNRVCGGRLAVLADDTWNTNIDFLRSPVNELNQGTPVILVDVAIPPASAQWASFRFRAGGIQTLFNKCLATTKYFSDKVAFDRILSYHSIALLCTMRFL